MEIIEKRKQTIIQLINDKNYKPMKQKELAYLLQVPSNEREVFHDMLMELVDEGRIIQTKRGKFQSLSDIEKTGVFSGNSKGFGFVSVEGEKEDYYISEHATNGALDGDKVLVKIVDSPRGRRREAEIVRILEHANKTVVGYYKKNKNFGFVIPDNRKLGEDIYIPQSKNMDAVTGHKVVARITSYGDRDHKAEGEIVEIIGHVNDPGTDIESIIRAYDLPVAFTQEVMSYVSEIEDTVSDKDIVNRTDLRNTLMVTIDGEDAKDLDDAVSLKLTDDGYELGVHIADVSHYVEEGSILDVEALNRGTSVYLADRVIPMLPHKLSNGICSLNQGEDRLALSCIMNIDNSGKVIDHSIVETVINVNRHMTYDMVYEILFRSGVIEENEVTETFEDEDSLVLEEYADYIDMFVNMKKLSDIIRSRRKERGSIDFDFPEAEVMLTDKGEPVEIGVRDRNPAHKIIEDFMLMANETIAEDYYWQELPFEFRVHDRPDKEKVSRLKEIIEKFGYYLKASTEDLHPKEFQKLLKSIEGTDEEGFVSRIVLRSMQQARYQVECSGHFGLAARYYCHFTSPIRRYPDLQIHRIIKENLHGRLTGERISHYNNILPEVAESNSKRERRAEEVEREVLKLKKVQFMSKRIGEVYEGIISGVTGYGFYVELDNTVEGMVRISSIPDDFFIYDEANMLIYGKETGITYQLGQKVKIVVVDVDKRMRTIDFEICT